MMANLGGFRDHHYSRLQVKILLALSLSTMWRFEWKGHHFEQVVPQASSPHQARDGKMVLKDSASRDPQVLRRDIWESECLQHS